MTRRVRWVDRPEVLGLPTDAARRRTELSALLARISDIEGGRIKGDLQSDNFDGSVDGTIDPGTRGWVFTGDGVLVVNDAIIRVGAASSVASFEQYAADPMFPDLGVPIPAAPDRLEFLTVTITPPDWADTAHYFAHMAIEARGVGTWQAHSVVEVAPGDDADPGATEWRQTRVAGVSGMIYATWSAVRSRTLAPATTKAKGYVWKSGTGIDVHTKGSMVVTAVFTRTL